MQKGGAYSWSIAVPNAAYQVPHRRWMTPRPPNAVYAMAPTTSSPSAGTPTAANHWVEGTITVTVTTGKLTITSAAGATTRHRLYRHRPGDAPAAPPPTANNTVGVNLDGNVDWSTAPSGRRRQDFRQWARSVPLQRQPEPDVHQRRFPPAGCRHAELSERLPQRPLQAYLTGAGTMTAYGMATIANIVPHRQTPGPPTSPSTTTTPTGTGGHHGLGIRGNVSTNPVKNIHLWPPGYRPGQTFTTDFPSARAAVRVLRFMDWAFDQNSPVIKWADAASRPPRSRPSRASDWEDVIELANEVNRNI